MSKPEAKAALVCGPGSEMESQAVRAALELFGVRVFMYGIGRPSDLIDILSGEDLYPDTDILILSFHGDEGKLVMPELEESVYEPGEPRGDFGPDEISRFAKLDGKIVFANGCSLGNPELARAFLGAGCRIYIGPDDDPYGNDALMFILHSFYEMIHHGKDAKAAYESAIRISDELSMYRFYENSGSRT